MIELNNIFSFSDIRFFAERLETKYPFLRCTIIGRSYEGRPIFAFSLGSRTNPVIITGGTGGRSAPTALALCRFTEKICESAYSGTEISGVNFSSLIKKFGITVIPCLNPDSCQVSSGCSKLPQVFPQSCDPEMWNANSAGVDIDLNFSPGWRKEKMKSLEKNILFACEAGYPGAFAHSEPEVRAFTTLCARRNFRSCLTVRISDRDMIYHTAEGQPPSSAMMAKIMASSGLFAVKKEEMPPCPSKWFCAAFSKPAFLLESENAENPAALYEKLEEALVLISVM